MKLLKLLTKRKEMLTGFLIAILLTACAGGMVIGVGCEEFARHRISMPTPSGASREFLEWLNLLDVGMLKVCKG